jgi:hypothetical protein
MNEGVKSKQRWCKRGEDTQEKIEAKGKRRKRD